MHDKTVCLTAGSHFLQQQQQDQLTALTDCTYSCTCTCILVAILQLQTFAELHEIDFVAPQSHKSIHQDANYLCHVLLEGMRLRRYRD